jgi:hypothetical protein
VTATKNGTFSNGYLNAAGNWEWKISIAPTSPVPTGATPLAAELGFDAEGANEQWLAAASLSSANGDDFDDPNPGSVIFGWETLTDVDPDPTVTNNKPVGVQISTANDQVFSALGSQIYTTTGDKDYIRIESLGPCVNVGASGCSGGDRLTTQIQMLGAYSGNGRIAELNGSGVSVNYDTYLAQFNHDFDPGAGVNITAKKGDANLDNSVGTSDFDTWRQNIGNPNATWTNGDFNDDGSIGTTDFDIWRTNIGSGAGAGGDDGGVSAVPEPATLSLFGLATLLLAGLRGRRR